MKLALIRSRDGLMNADADADADAELRRRHSGFSEIVTRGRPHAVDNWWAA